MADNKPPDDEEDEQQPQPQFMFIISPTGPHGPGCNCGATIEVGISQAPPLPPEQRALHYLWHGPLKKDRHYVSLTRMAKDTGLRYDQCETFVALFHAKRLIPRMVVLEEQQG